MPSAVAFLPLSMMLFVNLATSLSLNFGSGMMRRFGTSRLRGIGFCSRSGLGALHAVLGTLAVTRRLVGRARAGGAGRVERAANHVVTNAGQVLHATAADEHDGVLLQVVSLARDVARDFHLVRQA